MIHKSPEEFDITIIDTDARFYIVVKQTIYLSNLFEWPAQRFGVQFPVATNL